MRYIALVLLILVCFASSIALLNGCSDAAGKATDAPGLVLIGSTPADSEIRSLLQMPSGTIDFIRWELSLHEGTSKSFDLNLLYGESQQGTPGFIGGGTKMKLTGNYTIVKRRFGKVTRDVYQLASNAPSKSLALIRLNDNLFHLLMGNNMLMVGNAGWSYTLSKKGSVENSLSGFTLTDTDSILKDASTQITFEGRTPCSELLKDHNWTSSIGRKKLKWRIILKRDPATLLPTTYTMRRIDETAHDTEGKWEVIKNDNSIIYRLNSVTPGESISLLVGDANVIFVVDEEQRLYTGDSEFSYTLNRKANR